MSVDLKPGCLYKTKIKQYVFRVDDKSDGDRIPMKFDEFYLYLGTYGTIKNEFKGLEYWFCFLYNDMILCSFPDSERFIKIK